MGGNLSSDSIEKAGYARSRQIDSPSWPGEDRGLPRLVGYLRWAVGRGCLSSGCLDDDIVQASKWLESFGYLCSADGHMTHGLQVADRKLGHWRLLVRIR